MKLIGSFVEKSFGLSTIQIDIDNLKDGVNSYGNFFIKKVKNDIIYVIDKTCDHAGGRLIKKKNKAVCFLHGWELDLESLKYNNSHVGKKSIPFILENNTLSFDTNDGFNLINPFVKDVNPDSIKVSWINHATILIKSGNYSIITDPWLFGPAFVSGWWLEQPSNNSSIDDLKNADCIFVSHNHPDHLHPETLSIVQKDKLILTPNFISKSSEKYLKKLGFTNLKTMDFNKIYSLTQNLQISCLKSGDFRDDSGLYLNVSGTEILLTVDSNFLNSFKLPQNINLLATSFASGATGFPLIYDNLTDQEKLKIIERNKNSIKASVINYIKHTSPSYYLPYAGMFKEKAPRDKYISKNNIKNSVSDYSEICNENNVSLILPDKNVSIFFDKDNIMKLKKNHSNVEIQEQSSDYYINGSKNKFIYSANEVLDYFYKSGFKSNQVIQIIPTDDDFKYSNKEIVFFDFELSEGRIINENKLKKELKGKRLMTVKVREEAIAFLIKNMLPWEDLTIGFQTRITRTPDSYESDFWYYFTNVFVSEENYRYSPLCGNCSIINQNKVWIN